VFIDYPIPLSYAWTILALAAQPIKLPDGLVGGINNHLLRSGQVGDGSQVQLIGLLNDAQLDAKK